MTTSTVVKPDQHMEKDAFVVTLPLLASLAMGALSAHGVYSGAKNIAKGNYGAGAFDLATSIPFIGHIGKGLKAGGMLARIASRGGKIGNLGKRFASVGGSAAKAAMRNKVMQQAMNMGYTADQARLMAAGAAKGAPAFNAARAAKSWGITKALRKVPETIGKGYRAAGWMPKSAPMGSLSDAYQPISWGSRELARGMSSAGRRIEGVGRAINNTRLGRAMDSPAGFALMIGGPGMVGLGPKEVPGEINPDEQSPMSMVTGNRSRIQAMKELASRYGVDPTTMAGRAYTPGMPSGFGQ